MNTEIPTRTRSPRWRRTWIDWPKAARMIAEGGQPETVAAALGISEERVWRHLETSDRFRDLVRQATLRRQLLEAVTDPARTAGTA